jgi:hypothetical protein
MRWKKYKPGDRIFYECYDKSIRTDIVLSVEEKEYLSEQGYPVKYQWLNIDEYSGIENYICLPQNDPRVKELVKQYATFDKAKPSIIQTISDLLAPYSIELKKQLLKEIEVKL